MNLGKQKDDLLSEQTQWLMLSRTYEKIWRVVQFEWVPNILKTLQPGRKQNKL